TDARLPRPLAARLADPQTEGNAPRASRDPFRRSGVAVAVETRRAVPPLALGMARLRGASAPTKPDRLATEDDASCRTAALAADRRCDRAPGRTFVVGLGDAGAGESRIPGRQDPVGRHHRGPESRQGSGCSARPGRAHPEEGPCRISL